MANPLTHANVIIENNPYRGWVYIAVDAFLADVPSVDRIRVHRKMEPSGEWKMLYYVDVDSSEDEVTFVLHDITAVAGRSYSYNIKLVAGQNQDIVEEKTFDPIECEFEGLFIGNFAKQYIGQASYSTNSSRKTEVSYVTTLGSRYPFRVSNALVNYSTGSSSGLFFDFAEDIRYTNNAVPLSTSYYWHYVNKLVNFLTDGSDKILKTHDGHIWLVSIDDTVNQPFNDYYNGHDMVEFNWTEIGDVPDYGAAYLPIQLEDTLPEFVYDDNGNIDYRYKLEQRKHAFRVYLDNLEADGLSTSINTNGYIQLNT